MDNNTFRWTPLFFKVLRDFKKENEKKKVEEVDKEDIGIKND